MCPNLGESLPLLSALSQATERFCYPRGDILAAIRICFILTTELWMELTSLSSIQMARVKMHISARCFTVYVCSAALI